MFHKRQMCLACFVQFLHLTDSHSYTSFSLKVESLFQSCLLYRSFYSSFCSTHKLLTSCIFILFYCRVLFAKSDVNDTTFFTIIIWCSITNVMRSSFLSCLWAIHTSFPDSSTCHDTYVWYIVIVVSVSNIVFCLASLNVLAFSVKYCKLFIVFCYVLSWLVWLLLF